MGEHQDELRSLNEKHRTEAALLGVFMNSVTVEGGENHLPQTQPGAPSCASGN